MDFFLPISSLFFLFLFPDSHSSHTVTCHTVRTFWGILVSAHGKLFQVKQEFHLVYACNYFTFDFT